MKNEESLRLPPELFYTWISGSCLFPKRRTAVSSSGHSEMDGQGNRQLVFSYAAALSVIPAKAGIRMSYHF